MRFVIYFYRECEPFLRGKEVVLGELEVVVVAKFSQHSPCGLVAATLDEEAVEEEEATQCEGVSMDTIRDISSHHCLQLF